MHRIDLVADELVAVRVRRELEALEYEFDDETVELLKLAATELVTNSKRHSGSDKVVVFVRVSEPSLLIKVCDRGPGVHAEVTEPDPLAEGGRGLFLVEALAESWGTSQVDIDGSPWSCVWACFGAEALPVCASA
jgi:anti-sigma regulatory factor (Ser/Thr protein kinase)